MSARPEPPALGEGSAASLIAYYREHGESEHVAPVEAALTGEWLTSAEIAKVCGKSEHYCRQALEYLAVEGRAEREVEELPRPVRGVWWRYVWRAPSSDGASA